ncbi:Signal recognition particle 54 kDa protein 2 [Hordeum vulgare]|nr:Signal recognition particle 54 kDa protein 2 [Hordeum vulgare]
MEGMWRKAKRAMGIGICAHLPAVTGDRDDCASERRMYDAFSQDLAALAAANRARVRAQYAGAAEASRRAAPPPSASPQVQFASSPSANQRERAPQPPRESGEMVLAAARREPLCALARMTNATVVNERVLGDCLNEITRALLQADVQLDMVRDMQANVKRAVYLGALARRQPTSAAHQDDNSVFDELCNMLDAGKPAFAPKKGKPCVVMFVGLQGFKSALVCADTLRAGAFDQLKQNATKIMVPFYGSYMELDPVKIVVEGVESWGGSSRPDFDCRSTEATASGLHEKVGVNSCGVEFEALVKTLQQFPPISHFYPCMVCSEGGEHGKQCKEHKRADGHPHGMWLQRLMKSLCAMRMMSHGRVEAVAQRGFRRVGGQE